MQRTTVRRRRWFESFIWALALDGTAPGGGTGSGPPGGPGMQRSKRGGRARRRGSGRAAPPPPSRIASSSGSTGRRAAGRGRRGAGRSHKSARSGQPQTRRHPEGRDPTPKWRRLTAPGNAAAPGSGPSPPRRPSAPAGAPGSRLRAQRCFDSPSRHRQPRIARGAASPSLCSTWNQLRCGVGTSPSLLPGLRSPRRAGRVREREPGRSGRRRRPPWRRRPSRAPRRSRGPSAASTSCRIAALRMAPRLGLAAPGALVDSTGASSPPPCRPPAVLPELLAIRDGGGGAARPNPRRLARPPPFASLPFPGPPGPDPVLLPGPSRSRASAHDERLEPAPSPHRGPLHGRRPRLEPVFQPKQQPRPAGSRPRPSRRSRRLPPPFSQRPVGRRRLRAGRRCSTWNARPAAARAHRGARLGEAARGRHLEGAALRSVQLKVEKFQRRKPDRPGHPGDLVEQQPGVPPPLSTALRDGGAPTWSLPTRPMRSCPARRRSRVFRAVVGGVRSSRP